MPPIPRRASRRNWLAIAGFALVTVLAFHPLTAHAAGAGGGGGAMPWDAPLLTLRNDITGPVAFTLALLGMVAAGGALIFGGEINEFIRRIIMVVIVASFIVAATNLATALGITGAIIG